MLWEIYNLPQADNDAAPCGFNILPILKDGEDVNEEMTISLTVNETLAI